MYEEVLPPERYLTTFVRTPRLLRKPVRQKDLEEVRAQIRDDATAQGFAKLEGPVAVAMNVYPPELGQQPELPKVIKAYLDALEGIAYDDDRQVEFLEVRQSSIRHPMMDGYTPEPVESDDASIFIEVEPVEDYTERYDRAVRVALFSREAPWWPDWSVRDENKLISRRRELESTPELDREPLQAVVRNYEERRLTDGILTDIDRPGAFPKASRAVHRILPLQRFHRMVRRRGGAAFWISLPGGQKGSSGSWKQELQEAMDEFKAREVGLPLRGFVALDIAVRGASLEGKDLDNLAHGILVRFEETLCVRRGTVSCYRVYTALGEPDGVQVRVLSATRLLGLNIILSNLRGKPPLEERVKRWGEDMQDRLNALAEERGFG